MKKVLSVGPIFVGAMAIVTALAFLLQKRNIIPVRDFGKGNRLVFFIGTLLMIIGVVMWLKANFSSKLVKNIKENKLISDGIFAYVRHPIYSAFLHLFTGLILWMNNIYLLVLPFLFWIFLTILMVQTEERELIQEFGQEYVDYAKRTNRVIPIKKKGSRT